MGRPQVETPSSDSNVTAVGGTSARHRPRPPGTVTSESAWIDGGGGISATFTRGSWQTGPGVPAGTARLVPDVAAVADPDTGVYKYVDGRVVQIGGTSVGSPVWAGFCALLNATREGIGQGLDGLLGPYIYPMIETNDFRDIVSGNNGKYSAGVGYDMCTGVGVPSVAFLAQGIAAAAGVPGDNESVRGVGHRESGLQLPDRGDQQSVQLCSATGLPAGLTIDTSTGLISGVPSESGVFAIAFGGDQRQRDGNVSVVADCWIVPAR